jgi:hypothetical protein
MFDEFNLLLSQVSTVTTDKSTFWYVALTILYIPFAITEYFYYRSLVSFKLQKTIDGLIKVQNRFSSQKLNPQLLIGTVLDRMVLTQKIRIKDKVYSFETKIEVTALGKNYNNLSFFETYYESVKSSYNAQFPIHARKELNIIGDIEELKRFEEFCVFIEDKDTFKFDSDSFQFLLMAAGASMGALYDRTRLALGVIYIIQYVDNLSVDKSWTIAEIAEKTITLSAYLLPQQIETEYYSQFRLMNNQVFTNIDSKDDILIYIMELFENPDDN